ncbi:serine hydrolase [Thalassotalea sp. 1_MG-2023]|uniref:serine hydrolase domain-containing protein n=1 Tax=Thalassotalea sp. 1_MG-2023 TaxID=3062680 RepID=UPI0026E2CD9C|nr:serine hydrolase [Thalassotalea sp. 1_MG-2023]MDO6427679.1 serine hydrolase [Thalassotalea sp. 1_MG-2023]
MGNSKSLTLICFIFLLTLMTACGGESEKITLFLDGIAKDKLSDVYLDASADPNIINLAISVESPKQHFSWHKAGGVAYPNTGEEMTIKTPFRIASISKTLTATLIMQMVEAGNLTLSTPISNILTDSDMPDHFTINEIHQINGVSHGESLTIKQLLNHTSGLRDYIAEAPNNSAESYSMAALQILDLTGIQPSGISKQFWNSESLLKYFFSSGMNQHAINTPGENYHYSDTNYLLLGIIIEKLSGMSLADNYQADIYSRSQMNASYLEWYETNTNKGPAHHYSNLAPYGINENIDVIASGLNTSFDWAGGGIVSSIEELNFYVNNLFNNKLFQDIDTLKKMQQTVNVKDDNFSYGFGLKRKEYQLAHKTVVVYGHDGAWGSGMYYIPATGTSIVFTLNQTAPQKKDWLLEILRGLDKALLFTAIN